MKISIVIPAYNEEGRILQSLGKLRQYIDSREGQCQFEVIFVSDGSKDKTLDILQESRALLPDESGNYNSFVISNPINQGKGYSVKRGMLSATGDYVFFSDTDLSTPIEEIDRFLLYFKPGGPDVLIGSRALRGSKIASYQPLLRRFGGWLFRQMRRSLILPGIHDTQCGFKCFSRRAAQAIFPRQTMHGFIFDVEILYLAQIMGYKIVEIPVTWHNDQASKVNFVRDSAEMFWGLLKIRYNAFRNYYNIQSGG